MHHSTSRREGVHRLQPWDTGTRAREPDLDVLVDMVQALEVDGIFLDTIARGAADSGRGWMRSGRA